MESSESLSGFLNTKLHTELDVIDFSTSDDFAIVVENMKDLIILKTYISEFWNEEHEQNLWQFVIDPDSLIFLCYILDGKLNSSFSIPNFPVKELFYFIKTSADKLLSKDYDQKIMYGVVRMPYFESLYDLLHKVYFPMFVENTDWSKCVKTDYMKHQSKFLSQIFDLKNKFIGELIFYVPKYILELSVNTIIDNKELFNEVERNVMNWIWLLVNTLMKRSQNDTIVKIGPIEEMEFWQQKLEFLQKAINQLNRKDVEKCIEVLKIGKSGCLNKMLSVQQLIQSEAELASENVKFLSILQKPCELVSTSILKDIPKHLNILLNSLKIIWNNSSYFNANSEISHLLSKVNNFIIATFSNHIPLNDVFCKAIFKHEDIIHDVIHCCNSWIKIFHISDKAHQKYAEKYWTVESVAPLMNLFIHRCEELILVSKYKKQFKCDFECSNFVKGHKCFEIAEQFEAIESYFFILMQDLAKCKTSCLDIHSTIWHDHFKNFKNEVRSLEITVSKLMSNAFDNHIGIEEGIEILMMFKKYFKKEIIKRDLQKCIKSLYEKFFDEVSFIKKKLFESKSIRNPLLPNHGGVAFCISKLTIKLKMQYKTLQSTAFLWPELYTIDITEYYQQVQNIINESIHTLFLQWVKTIPKDPYNWLKGSVINKLESSHFIEINIDDNIINLIEELFYWDKTGIEIPHQVVKLLEKSNIYSKRISKIAQCVNSYNRIISILMKNKEGMFKETLMLLEENVLASLLDLNWTSPQTSLNTTLRILIEQTKSAYDSFFYYEENNAKISKLCNAIGNKCLFTSNIRSPMEIPDFLEMQNTYRKAVLGEVYSVCLEIISIARKVQNTFKKKKPENEEISLKYVDIIGKHVCDYLVKSVLTTLQAVSSLFGIYRKNKMKMILKIFLNLKQNQLCFYPTFKDVCNTIDGLIEASINEMAGIMNSEEFFENFKLENIFHEGLKENISVKEIREEIDYGLYKLYEDQIEYKKEWKPFFCLWETNKSSIVKKYESQGWNAISFEEDINEFLQIAGKIPFVPQYKSLDYCICDCNSLKKSAIACSEAWKNDLGSIFRNISCSNLQNAYDLLELTSINFLNIPKTLEEFKHCLRFLITAKDNFIKVQSTFNSIHITFAILKKFNIIINIKSIKQEKYLEYNWKNLEKKFSDYYIKLQNVQAHHHRHLLEFHSKFKQQVCLLQKDLHLNGPFQLHHNFIHAICKILIYKTVLIDFKEKESQMTKDSKFFNLNLELLDTLKSIESELDNLRIAWVYSKQMDDYVMQWGYLDLIHFDVDQKKIILSSFKKMINTLKQNVKGNHWILLEELLSNLNNLDEYFKIIMYLQEPTLQERHWNDLKDIFKLPPCENINFFKTNNFNFNFLQNFSPSNLLDKTHKIAFQAKGEFEIEQTLNKMSQVWDAITFEGFEDKSCYKLSNTENIISIVEDQQTLLQTIKTSNYVTYYSGNIDLLENSLRLILDGIEQAEYFQNKFSSLETIFSEQTVQAQLPKESIQFQEISFQWKDIGKVIQKEKFVWKISQEKGFLEDLIKMNEKIQNIQKSLETYLESKRKIFPRFYFISDDDLLSIIGQSNPQSIQKYLRKCFDGINHLEIVETEQKKEIIKKVTGMHSKCNEYVRLVDSINLEGPVEFWMLEIEEKMYSTLKKMLPKCLEMLFNIIEKEDFNFTETNWLFNWPGQISLLSIQIAWTAEVTAAIKSVQESAIIAPLKLLKKKWREILNQFILKHLRYSQLLMQLKNMAMITTLVHACAVIDCLIKYICNDLNAFEWLVQLRYYYNKEKHECFIQQTKAIFKYGFEYLGNTERLVITPLTERCFVSITTAFMLHQGILMKGSKSTGKTETLRELGKILGSYVLIINCSKSLTHSSLLRMVSGLIQIGAWGIIEGFNNINHDVLSVLLQQISVIFQALALGINYISFLGKEMHLQESCGIFLNISSTYNICSYSQSSFLFDIFRPITMIKPDLQFIIEVHLLAYGFHETKNLSKDIYLIFKLSEEQLSVQDHYDFGLCMVIAFLKNVSNMKRASFDAEDSNIIVASLKKTILPKLIAHDIPVFETVMNSILGSVKDLGRDVSDIKDYVKRVFQQNFLQPTHASVLKVLEFSDLKKFYHAIILLGPSGSGKTTTLKMLKDTYHLQNCAKNKDSKISAVHTYNLNPKAFSLNELMGHFNERDIWINGLCPVLLYEACNNLRATEKWIIFNGPVDIQWIECISSLLDKTRVLTLANGERILLSDEVYFVIEATNLIHCSPAAISQCGVIYHQSDNVSWEIYFQSWIKTIEHETISNIVEKLGKSYLGSLIEFYFKSLNNSKVIFTNHINCISSFCKIMRVLMKKITSEENFYEKLVRLFWISAIWSIGSTLDEIGQQLFDEFLRSLITIFPGPGSVFDYGLNNNLEWTNWSNLLPTSWKLNKGVSFKNIIVPTKTSVAYNFILGNLLDGMHPVFLVGKSGSGKTVIAQNLLNSLNSEHFKYMTWNVTYQTTSNKIQNVVESEFEKKAGNIFLPENGKKCVLFLDDLNLAQPDKYQSVSCIELINMFLCYKCWYNRETWKTNYIQNCCFLCSMSLPRYGQWHPSQSFLSHFNVINLLPQMDSELKYIFISLLKEKYPDPNFSLQKLLNAISLGTLQIYKTVTKLFLPSPSRLHYLFSMHDIKNIFMRLLEANPKHLHDKIMMTKFWFYECMREFSDKLISARERNLLFKNLCKVAENQFLIKYRFKMEDKLIFAKFLNPTKGYDEIDLGVLMHYFKNSIKDFEKIHQSESVVLFNKAVEHLCRIIRGIELFYGNMLLIGIHGTGRQTLSRLAAFILNYQLLEIKPQKLYEVSDFKKDLKNLMYRCGVKKENILFLLPDFHFISDDFLQCVTEVLVIGEVPDLFKSNELTKIYKELNVHYDIDLKKDFSHNIFIDNIKKHLHLVICVTYGTPFYKKCMLNYPAISKYLTTDWFEDWPKEVLEYVAVKFIEDFEVIFSTKEMKVSCSQVLSEMHESVMEDKERKGSHLKSLHSSATFIILVNTFKNILTKSQENVKCSMQQLETGLLKISETQKKVDEIAKETQEAREKLVIAEKECDEALLDIQAKKIIVAEKQEAIQRRKVDIENNEKICKKIAIATQEDLNAVLPALEDARKALEALNKRDISEIKSYAKPPILVELVLEAVMILRNSEPSWAEAKKQLGNPSFLKELIEYDRDNISDLAHAKVGKYIKKSEFQPSIVGKVSVAAKSLCIWVHAMHLYGDIYKKVKPKKERLKMTEKELDKLQKILSSLLKELEELQAVILKLEKEHVLLLNKREEYAKIAKILTTKLERANDIMQGLSSEKDRWNQKCLVLNEKRKCMIGDSFLASGYLSYLGPHDPYYRMYMCNIWKRKIMEHNFICDSEFNLAEFFMDETIITEWITNGLPSDQYSHEGAAIIAKSFYSPFIIDPEGQAVKWIKNMELKQGLKCCDLQSMKWIPIMERAIVEGFPILLQTMNCKLTSTLISLLQKINQVSNVVFNNKDLNVHSEFRLYISTKSSNIEFHQNIVNQICIVNFTIKEKGLEDQLLPLIVKFDQPELEVKKEKLVKSIRASKKQLLDIENTILKLLSESQQSLLEDELLVDALKKSKSTSTEIEEKLKSNEQTETYVDVGREMYRSAAQNAAVLYFVLSDMTLVDSIYVFSLDSYFKLVLDSLQKSPYDADVARRVKKLKLYHQYAVFKFGCRTVTEKHSLLFAFHLCCKLLRCEGVLDADEYEFLIHGGKSIDPASHPQNPCQWLPQKCWDLIIQLDQLPKFFGLTVSFDEISKSWNEWYLTNEPEKAYLPGNWRNSCNEFEKLLIIRCLRVDRITNCIRNFIRNNLGKRFLKYPHMSLKDVLKESVPNKPIILFFLSIDINPEKVVNKLAKTYAMSDRYRAISLGQGQGSAATQLISDAAKMGFWAFIFNCHLLPTWFSDLEKIVEKLQNLNLHPDFRLLLGSYPNGSFPVSILRNCAVLTLDAPKGIHANMLNLYKTNVVKRNNWNQNGIKFRSLLFSLSFFHSVLVERNKFQNLGWNANYNFAVADFEASAKLLYLYLNEYKDIPWDALKYTIAEVCYKNHIVDEKDEHLLISYYEQYFCEEACSNVKFPLSSVDGYYIPEDGSIEKYLEYIKMLPSVDEAEVFGQNTNAEIPYRIQEGQVLLQNIYKIQGESFVQKTRNIEIHMVKVLEDLNEEIPSIINEEASTNILLEKPDPFNFILMQETKRYNTLVIIVKNSLKSLIESIRGEQKMTEKTEMQLVCIQKMEVPNEWQLIYPSLKPLGSWIQDLKLRIQQFQDWCSTGNAPIKFWLSGFTCPKSVLNATLLTMVKNRNVMLKELVWEYHVSTLDEVHIKEAPDVGIYVHGLFLEGAGWDRTNSIIIDSEPLHLVTALPVIHFKPVIESSMRGLYACPCYYTSERINDAGKSSYLFDIELKTKKPQEYWIKRGIAIIMSNKE